MYCLGPLEADTNIYVEVQDNLLGVIPVKNKREKNTT